MTDRMISVLVVDDSKVAQMLLVHILESDPEIRVVGAVSDGQAALDFIKEHAPDVILMDLHMPGMDGFEATRRIMETQPVPIIVCTATTDPLEVATTFRVMEAGAVACVGKPVGRGHADFDEMAENIRQTVKLMSEVKVVRRWARARLAPAPTPVARPAELDRAPAEVTCIGIGASTGGPQVLQEILAHPHRAAHRARLSARPGRVAESDDRLPDSRWRSPRLAAARSRVSGARRFSHGHQR